jgi:NADPH:quinone reductase-like Zn-dependent oxidoreductase
MKAIVQNHYGSPGLLELKEVPKPEIEDHQVLVRVAAASLNAGDLFTVRGDPWLVRLSMGFPKPKDHILGWDMAGQIVEVGRAVTDFQPGNEVYSACNGSFAEYVRVDADRLALKPTNLTFEEAAAVPTAALTALIGLRDAGQVKAGQKVLIHGASGGVGTFAVQIAKALGAEVAGVCSTRNVELVRTLGAAEVFDYTQTDFTQSGNRYDLILDNVAARSFRDLRQVLTPEGQIIPNSGHGGMGYVLKAFIIAMFSRQQGTMFMATTNTKDLTIIQEFIAAGQVKPIIDKTYPLDEVPAALQYMADKHAQGKIVITVAQM